MIKTSDKAITLKPESYVNSLIQELRLINVDYPVIDKDKQKSEKERINKIDLQRNIFTRFDFHFYPKISRQKYFPEHKNYKGYEGNSDNIISPPDHQ